MLDHVTYLYGFNLEFAERLVKDLSDEQMVSLMLQEPRLVRRPLVRMGGRLLVGANLKAVEAALRGGD